MVGRGESIRYSLFYSFDSPLDLILYKPEKRATVQTISVEMSRQYVFMLRFPLRTSLKSVTLGYIILFMTSLPLVAIDGILQCLYLLNTIVGKILTND